MGRGGGKPIQLMQVFLPLQDQFRCRQRIREQARLLRYAIGIEGGKGSHRDDGAPHAQLQERMDFECSAFEPGEGIGREGEKRNEGKCRDEERDRMTARLRREGNDDGDADQGGEGIVEATRYEEQRTHLKQIEGQHRESRGRLQPIGWRKGDR